MNKGFPKFSLLRYFMRMDTCFRFIEGNSSLFTLIGSFWGYQFNEANARLVMINDNFITLFCILNFISKSVSDSV